MKVHITNQGGELVITNETTGKPFEGIRNWRVEGGPDGKATAFIERHGSLATAQATVDLAVQEAEERVRPHGVDMSDEAWRLAQQEGADLAAITGTGTGGKIILRDVQQYLKARDD